MKRFPDGSRVCFIGDSITHNNGFLAHIVAYYRKFFPESMVEFYNCGISGGTLTTVLHSFDEDILPYQPTHVVMMIGINDSNRNALNGPANEKFSLLLRAFEGYKKNLKTLCDRLDNMGVGVTLCTPMPYAEYMESEIEVLRGGSALLLGYADFVKAYAKEQGYSLCDYHTYATRVMQNEAIYNPDRVHPTPRGHYYMAKCFLESQGLELGDETELPPDVQKWSEVVLLVRNTIATEHFILNDDFTTTPQERWDAIQNYLECGQPGPYETYFKQLSRQYLEIKPHQRENIQFTIDFMRNR